MSSVPYETRSGWSWPKETASEPLHEEDIPLPGTYEDEKPELREEVPTQDTNSAEAPSRPQRHYPPRTCRICLEEVLPSFEPASEGIASMLNPSPKVAYISSDPTAGRLIRPCKCRGSQAYVHEGCLQEWRHADPRYGKRNFWECPTCKFRYRLERMAWSRWISSTITQIVLTVAIMFTAIFMFGFVADPIINLYLDPYETITSLPRGGSPALQFEDEDGSWIEHFLKGLASMGLLGFVKVFFAMGPWQWWNLRQVGIVGGRARRRGGTGRERLEDISWSLVLIGVVTFLYAIWTWVRNWSRRTLEKAGERVADVQGDDDGEAEEQSAAQ